MRSAALMTRVAEAWQVIGLHHAGGVLEQLDPGQPEYEANEGIRLRAIRDATKRAG
jgi:hypothetical protein